MKIGIDARLYGPKQGGLGRYLEQLITNLEKIDSKNDYFIFLKKDNWNEYQPKNKSFIKVMANIHWYSLKEQILLPRILKKHQLDLMHFPHWNIPLFYRKDFIVTIHDLILLRYPSRKASTLGPIKYFFKNLAYKIVLKNAVKRSKHIISVSEHTKKDIIEYFNIKPEQITTTLLGCLPTNYAEGTNDTKILQKYNIAKPYIVYAGSGYPHKNVEMLLDAWKDYLKKYGNKHHLVLIWKKDYFYEKLEQKVKTENIANVIFTGFIGTDLPIIYKNADLYVFPTLCEGFGLPPLEAIQQNTPVISSNASCMPEILKDAALFFNPSNKNEIIEAMHRGLTDQNLRAELKLKGQNILPEYSWGKTAKKTLEIYENNV